MQFCWKWNLNDVLPLPCTSEEEEDNWKNCWRKRTGSLVAEEVIVEELGLDFIEPDKVEFSLFVSD